MARNWCHMAYGLADLVYSICVNIVSLQPSLMLSRNNAQENLLTAHCYATSCIAHVFYGNSVTTGYKPKPLREPCTQK